MVRRLSVVGLGPGDPRHRTSAAETAVREADVVVGYQPYLDQCADLITTDRVIVGTMGGEEDRARQAVELAARGHRVALVSSGDPGVFGMAGLAVTGIAALPVDRRPELEIIPGVTAALAAGALVGAPFARDFACLTLSDVRTPWPVVERRLTAIAAADIALALYNPRSKTRTWQFDHALAVLRDHRGDVPVALVTDAARPGQRISLHTLSTVDPETVGMRTVVLVGASTTRRVGDWLVSPRDVPE